MCPELQYTKDRNENNNQVKTQQLSSYESKCVLNTKYTKNRQGCSLEIQKKKKKKPKKYQDFDLRAWLENFHPFEAQLHHKRNQNQCQIGLYCGGKVIL